MTRKEEIMAILKYFEENDDKYVITSHVNPDGDNIGSSIGIFRFLEKLGKEVNYVIDDEYPSNLTFLYNEKIKQVSEEIQERGQTVIALDAGSYERICIDRDILEKSKGIICIDHHETNGDYGFLTFIDRQASSTCELVYDLIKAYEETRNKEIIDEEIATALYTGLVTDTGNFQYSNTASSSFLMAAELLGRGANKANIIERLFQSNSPKYYQILGSALEGLEVVEDKIAVISVSKEQMDKYGVSYDDIDGITPYTRDIEGVELGIFIKEKEEGLIKVSLRSKNYVDCTKIAQTFGGGGHMRASGLTMQGKDITSAKQALLECAKQYI